MAFQEGFGRLGREGRHATRRSRGALWTIFAPPFSIVYPKMAGSHTKSPMCA
jgi:hypothetical protein